MKKEAIRSQNSPMSASGWPAVIQGRAVNDRRALIPAVRAAGRAKGARAAGRPRRVAACMADASVRPGPAPRQGLGARRRPRQWDPTAQWDLAVRSGRRAAVKLHELPFARAKFRSPYRAPGASHSGGDKWHISRRTGQRFGENRGSVTITLRDPARRVGPANDYRE